MMNIQGKVAIVTGAGTGMGFEFVVELLKKGAKGVTLIDISEDLGEEAVQKLAKDFDTRRILFVKADISNYKEFEVAFEKTLSTFNNIDILINNAGILDETQWQRMVQINLMGTTNGILLAMENYIPKHKSGEEGVIMNVSSIAGVIYHGGAPIYCGTKFAIHGMTLSWGVQAHYERTKVRVVALAPGGTKTNLFHNAENKVLSPIYKEILVSEAPPVPFQEPNIVGKYGMKVIEAAPNGTFWIVEANEPPYRYDMPDRFQIRKSTLE